MRKILCLAACAVLLTALSIARAEEAASAFPLSVEDQEPFLASSPFFYSYESGQWVSSSPGSILTAGERTPDFELPQLKDKPEPIRYPRWALNQGWKGRFIVAVEIREDGTVGRWKVMRSTGRSLLDRAAVEAVRKWRFLPGKRKGRPMASCVQIPVHFVLK